MPPIIQVQTTLELVTQVTTYTFAGTFAPGDHITLAESGESWTYTVALPPVWQPNYYYSQGDLIRTTAPRDFYLFCSSSGFSGATEPAWGPNYAAVQGTVIADRQVKWNPLTISNAMTVDLAARFNTISPVQYQKLGLLNAGGTFAGSPNHLVLRANQGGGIFFTVTISTDSAAGTIDTLKSSRGSDALTGCVCCPVLCTPFKGNGECPPPHALPAALKGTVDSNNSRFDGKTFDLPYEGTPFTYNGGTSLAEYTFQAASTGEEGPVLCTYSVLDTVGAAVLCNYGALNGKLTFTVIPVVGRTITPIAPIIPDIGVNPACGLVPTITTWVAAQGSGEISCSPLVLNPAGGQILPAGWPVGLPCSEFFGQPPAGYHLLCGTSIIVHVSE